MRKIRTGVLHQSPSGPQGQREHWIENLCSLLTHTPHPLWLSVFWPNIHISETLFTSLASSSPQGFPLNATSEEVGTPLSPSLKPLSGIKKKSHYFVYIYVNVYVCVCTEVRQFRQFSVVSSSLLLPCLSIPLKHFHTHTIKGGI